MMTKITLTLALFLFSCFAQAEEPKRLMGFITFECSAEGVCTKTGDIPFVVNKGLVVDGKRLDATAQVDLVDSTLAAPESLEIE